jgi:DNA excision repair protein ERCC-8
MLPRLLQSRSLGLPHGGLQRQCTDRLEAHLTLSRRRQLESPHRLPISSLAVDPSESRYLLSGGLDGVICCFDVCGPVPGGPAKRQPPLFTAKQHEFNVASVLWYTVDTGLFLSGGSDATVRLWDTNRVVCARVIDVNEKVNQIAMAPRGTTHTLVALATGDPAVGLLDLRTAAITHRLPGHRVPNWTVAWSPSNQYFLVSGSSDGSIRMWDVRRSGCLGSLDPYGPSSPEPPGLPPKERFAHSSAITAVTFTPDGRHVVSTSQDGTLRMWDLLDSASLVHLPIPDHRGNPHTGCSQLSISPSGHHAYVPSDREVVVFSLVDGTAVGRLQGHFDIINATALQPNTQTLYTGAMDRSILAWGPPEADSSPDGGPGRHPDNEDAWSDADGG